VLCAKQIVHGYSAASPIGTSTYNDSRPIIKTYRVQTEAGFECYCIYQWNIKTFYERQRVQLVSGNTILSNSAYQSYKHRELSARGFYVLPSSNTEFLVTTSRAAEFIIKLPPSETPLAIGFCSCLKYQDYQAPCSHAIACIQYLSLNPFDYFYPYYRWDVSLRTYSLPITPVSIQGLLIVEDNSLPLLPPIKKPKRGRPKISRIRSSHLSEIIDTPVSRKLSNVVEKPIKSQSFQLVLFSNYLVKIWLTY